MVNYCVCGGCTNTSLSGHRVHRFPNKTKDGSVFRAWVRFVQAKRRDFTHASASRNAVVCSFHFRPEDYRPGDVMEFNMGCRTKNQVRLKAGAVPSVHTAPSSGRPAAASVSATGGRHDGHGSVGDAPRRKRETNPWDREVYCPRCCKPQTKITVHLRKACMKGADAESIEQEVLRAKELQMKWSKEGRIINVTEVKEILTRDPTCGDLAEYFQRKGFFITYQDNFHSTANEKKEVLAQAKMEMDYVFKKLVEKQNVSEKNQTAFRRYCVATLMWMHNQTCKSIIEFKVQDWIHRRKEGDQVLIQLSKSNTVKLSKQEEAWFDCYFCNIRPGYLKKSNNQELPHFFLGISGDALKNPAVDVERLRSRYVSRILKKASTTVAMPKEHVTDYNPPVSLWMSFEKQFPITLHGNPPTQKQHVLDQFTEKTTWTTNIPAVNNVLLAWVPPVLPAPVQIESDVSTVSLSEQERIVPAIQKEEEVEMGLSTMKSFTEHQGTELVIKKEEVDMELSTINSFTEQHPGIDLVIKKEEEIIATMEFTGNQIGCDYHSEEVPKQETSSHNFTETSSVFFKSKEGNHLVKSIFEENKPFL